MSVCLPDYGYGRMVLSMGGNDITEFLYVLFEKIGFPYRDINLARSYDWNVMEDLKARLCTLAEVRISICRNLSFTHTLSNKGDVALNLYDFSVRRPGNATEKYGLRAYDEIILAPMVSPSSCSPIYVAYRTGSVSLNHASLSSSKREAACGSFCVPLTWLKRW